MRREMRWESGAMAIEAMAIEAKAREGQKARRGEVAEEASTLAAAAWLVLLWPCSPPNAVTKAQRSLGLSSEASVLRAAALGVRLSSLGHLWCTVDIGSVIHEVFIFKYACTWFAFVYKSQ